MDFTNKTVLVTGGSRGIGKAIAFAFAKKGARVAVLFRSDQVSADKTLAELEGKIAAERLQRRELEKLLNDKVPPSLMDGAERSSSHSQQSSPQSQGMDSQQTAQSQAVQFETAACYEVECDRWGMHNYVIVEVLEPNVFYDSSSLGDYTRRC